MEGIGPHLIKGLTKVFMGPKCFLNLKYVVLNADAVRVMQKVELESMYVAEAIEVDWLKLILEDSHSFFLQRACKPEGNTHNFGKDLIGDIVLRLSHNPLS